MSNWWEAAPLAETPAEAPPRPDAPVANWWEAAPLAETQVAPAPGPSWWEGLPLGTPPGSGKFWWEAASLAEQSPANSGAQLRRLNRGSENPALLGRQRREADARKTPSPLQNTFEAEGLAAPAATNGEPLSPTVAPPIQPATPQADTREKTGAELEREIRASENRALLVRQAREAAEREKNIREAAERENNKPGLLQRFNQWIGVEEGTPAVPGEGAAKSDLPGARRTAPAFPASPRFIKNIVDTMDRIDRGEPVREIDDVIGYQHLSPEQRRAQRASIEGITALAGSDVELPKAKEMARQPGPFARGFVSGLLEQNPQMTAEAFEGLSHLDLAPADVRVALRTGSRGLHDLSKLSPELFKRTTDSMWDIKNIDEALNWAHEMMGVGVASSAPGIVLGTLGALFGGRVAGRPGALIGGGLGAVGPSSVLNYGEVYKALKDEKIDPKLATKYALYAAAPMAMLDTVSIGPIIKRLGGFDVFRRELARGLARRIAAEGGKGIGRESITELLQEMIKDATVSIAAGKPFWTIEHAKGWVEAAVGGGLGGAPLSAASGIRPDKVMPRAPSPAQPARPAGAEPVSPAATAPEPPAVAPTDTVRDTADGRIQAATTGAAIPEPDTAAAPTPDAALPATPPSAARAETPAAVERAGSVGDPNSDPNAAPGSVAPPPSTALHEPRASSAAHALASNRATVAAMVAKSGQPIDPHAEEVITVAARIMADEGLDADAALEQAAMREDARQAGTATTAPPNGAGARAPDAAAEPAPIAAPSATPHSAAYRETSTATEHTGSAVDPDADPSTAPGSATSSSSTALQDRAGNERQAREAEARRRDAARAHALAGNRAAVAAMVAKSRQPIDAHAEQHITVAAQIMANEGLDADAALELAAVRTDARQNDTAPAVMETFGKDVPDDVQQPAAPGDVSQDGSQGRPLTGEPVPHAGQTGSQSGGGQAPAARAEVPTTGTEGGHQQSVTREVAQQGGRLQSISLVEGNAIKSRPDKKRMDAFKPMIREYQELAKRYGVGNILQDNNSRLLEVALTLNLTVLPGRQGNDARDETGREFELKSVNIDQTMSFSTHNRLNPTVLSRYRSAGWIFAIYRDTELASIHMMDPKRLEPFFTQWEAKWHADGGKNINNPKIPVRFVIENGLLLHGKVPDFQSRPARASPTKPHPDTS